MERIKQNEAAATKEKSLKSHSKSISNQVVHIFEGKSTPKPKKTLDFRMVTDSVIH